MHRRNWRFWCNHYWFFKNLRRLTWLLNRLRDLRLRTGHFVLRWRPNAWLNYLLILRLFAHTRWRSRCLVIYCTYTCHGLIMVILLALSHRSVWYWCLWSVDWTAFQWSLETKRWNIFSVLILNLVFALLHIFKIINNYSAGVCSNSNCTPVNAKHNLVKNFSGWKCDYLMWVLIAWTILIDVNLFHFLAHSDIIEIYFAVHTTWSQQKMVDLWKCNSSARLTTVSVEHKLFAFLTQPMRALSENSRCIPNHNLPIFVRWCKNMPFHNWKFYHSYLNSISTLILRMMW